MSAHQSDNTKVSKYGGYYKITSVRIYPIKSCQGIFLEECEVTEWGFKNDRRWAIVGRKKDAAKDSAWHIENIFELHPELAKIHPEISADGKMMTLSAHGMDKDLKVPIRDKAGLKEKIPLQPLAGNPSIAFAEDEGAEADAWIQTLLSTGAHAKDDFKLVWMPPDTWAKPCMHPTYGFLYSDLDKNSFAAKSQYMIANDASMADLNESIKKMGDAPVDISRLRPNIIFTSSTPWCEEDWKTLKIGEDFVLHTCMSAIRCAETTVHMRDELDGAGQSSWAGSRDKSMQPLKAMKKYHGGPEGKPRFGFTLDILLDAEGLAGGKPEGIGQVVKIGDHITVVEHTEASLMNVGMSDPKAAELMTLKHTRGETMAMAKDIESVEQRAASGDGTINNVGIKTDGTIQCAECRQKYTNQKALDLHYKFTHDPNRHIED